MSSEMINPRGGPADVPAIYGFRSIWEEKDEREDSVGTVVVEIIVLGRVPSS